MGQPGNQHQLAATDMRRHVHAVHHRQQGIGGAVHHQGWHAQAVEQLDPTGFGQHGQQLALDALRVVRAVVAACRLAQQRGAVIADLRAAEGRQQVGLLLQCHLAVGRLTPRQQLQQLRAWRRQALGTAAGHQQRQAAHPLGGQVGHVLGDHPAHAGTEQMKLLDAQLIHQLQAIGRHVAQVIRRLDRQAQAIADGRVGQAGFRFLALEARQADVTVIESDHPPAGLAKAAQHLVRPVDQLPAQAHHQQQGRIAVAADALVGQAHLGQVGHGRGGTRVAG